MAQNSNVIIPQSAIEGITKTNTEIVKLDESTYKFIQTVDQLATSLKNNKITLEQVQKAQKKTQENVKKSTSLEKEQKKASEALEKQRQKGLSQMAKTEAKERELQAALKKEIKTEQDLINKTNALVKVRKNLDQTTESGKKKHAELTKEIKKNTDVLKGQDKQIGRSQRNVGNYTSALTGLIPGLGGVATGFGAITKASLTFIATPIGAVIAALVLGFKALTTYFKSSEEGQNALNKIMKVSGVIMGNISDLVSKVGKAIYEAFTNPQEAVKNLWEIIKQNIVNRIQGVVGQFKAMGRIIEAALDLDWDKVKEGAIEFGEATMQSLTGIEDLAGKASEAIGGVINETEKEIEIAQKLADLEAKRDLLQRKLIVDQEKLRAESRELRLKAEQAEGEERIRLLQEAFKIEDELAMRRLEIAEINLKLKSEENKLSNSTKEDLNEEAELESILFVIQQERLKLQRTLQTQINTEQSKINTGKEKEIELIKKAAEEEAKAASLVEFTDEEEEINEDDPFIDQLGKRLISIIDFSQKASDEVQKQADIDVEILDKALEQKLISEEEYAAAKAKIDEEAAKESKSKIQEGLAIAQSTANSAFSIYNAGLERQSQILENQKEYELSLAEGNATEQAAINEKFEKKEIELQKKKDKSEKTQALFSIALSTAMAIASVSPNPVLMILAGALGAIQLAVAASTPLPQYYTGIDSVPTDSPVMVGDRGRELIKKDGKMMIANQPTIATGLKGAKVWNNAETEMMLSGRSGGSSIDISELSEKQDRTNKYLRNMAVSHNGKLIFINQDKQITKVK